MKRTCDGCRALTQSGPSTFCGLGFRMKTKLSYAGLEYIPDEPCPKPITHRQHVDFLLWRDVGRWKQEGE